MTMDGTNSYGPTPYGAPAYAGAPPPVSNGPAGDPAALSRSIDDQLKAYTARGPVPTGQGVTVPFTPITLATAPRLTVPALAATADTDPTNQGNVSWALLMEMKLASGEALTPAEQGRYDGIMARAKGGAAPNTAGPAPVPSAADTDPANQGNVSWALLMEMKLASGEALTPAEQGRYDGIMARAKGGAAPSASGAVVAQPQPTDVPAAPATPLMSQETYDAEVKWALTFEKSPDAVRYNAFNKEKKVRNGTSATQGAAPTMDDATFTREAAWAQQFSQSPDILRYKRVAAEVQRRKASGERTRPTGMLDKVKTFFSGIFSRFSGKKSQAAPQPPAGGGDPANALPSGVQAPAPTTR